LFYFTILFSVLPFSAGAADEESYLKYTSSGIAFGGGNDIQIDQDIQGIWCLQVKYLRINEMLWMISPAQAGTGC
jgi:hypothetical protein